MLKFKLAERVKGMQNHTEYSYKPKKFESYWRDEWEKNQQYNIDNEDNKNKPKYYCLDMFPYPSGSGLHVGHWRGYVLSDVWARYKMLQGFNVLHPMGWDNFGLPAENDAIKKGIHPRISTNKNIENMRRQLKEIGCIYDWSKQIDTTDPDYYKWTQWIFLQMFNKGLAYQKQQPVNWCSKCRVVLANEEVEGGKCERCGWDNIEKKNIKQWMLKITEYAERLLNDLDDLDWPEKVKEMQRNWIGKSKGASVKFNVIKRNKETEEIEVFTTRPDTLFGATFMVFAPEHELISEIVTPDKKQEVDAYIKKAQSTSSIERQRLDKEKTGVFTGAYAINPVNNEKVPIWISDYVLIDYGTGAIMAVPAHDERDFGFAQKFDIPIIEVIYSENATRDKEGNLLEAHAGDGKYVNSDFLDGLSVQEGKKKMIEELEKRNIGKAQISYKLRDWIFARQRYWGEPIPIIHCKSCGTVGVPEKDLPVKLPNVESYQPSEDGQSPLAKMPEWVNTNCPTCGGEAKRETDTMPQWAGSSWYFLRYPCHDYKEAVVDDEAIKKWLPVDMYVGGIEHAVLHLLYARFWTKFLYDEGVVSFKEPFKRLFNQGMVCRKAYKCEGCNKWIADEEISKTNDNDDHLCASCGGKIVTSLEKMSKSKGNGVGPDELVQKYGTDSLRMYELFTGDPMLDSEWNDDGIKACFNLLRKSWDFVVSCNFKDTPSKEAQKLVHGLIKKIDNRMNSFKFNTAVSAFMEFMNEANNHKDEFSKDLIEMYIITLAPFAPHFSEELWRNFLKNERSVFTNSYPVYDEELAKEDMIDIIVQVNGRLKGRFTIEPGSSSQQQEESAKNLDVIQDLYKEDKVKKVIVVPGRIVNFVVK